MAATATISTSTMIPVVGESTMSLVGASSPPTTPPATPTSPTLSSSKAILDSDPIDVEASLGSVEVQRGMAATPPPSPPPAPVTTALLPVTPFPIDSEYDAPLMATLTAETVGFNCNGAGHSLSEVEVISESTIAEAATAAASVSTLATVSISEPITGSGSETMVTPTATVSIPTGEATTFFDDMINAPQPPANILTLSPTTSIPDLYHDFFDNHPELYDSDNSSDPEMDLDLEDLTPAIIRARTMADFRQTSVTTIQAPLIADRPKLETIDTINLMIHHQNANNGNSQQPLGMHMHNGAVCNSNGQHSSDDSSASHGPNRRKKASRACFHCQKAHLTSLGVDFFLTMGRETTRPCQRCVKRDLAGSCTDGVRKKAKYLQDAFDSQQQAAEQVKMDQGSGCIEGSALNDADALFSFTNVPSSISSHPSTLSTLTSKAVLSTNISNTASINDSTCTTTTSSTTTTAASGVNNSSANTTTIPDHGFGSEAINLEYSILSTMLSSPTAELQSMTSELSMVENWQRQGALEAMANSLQQQHQHQHQLQSHMQRSTLALQQQLYSNNSNNSGNNNNSSNGTVSHTGAARVSKRKFPSNTPENVYANTKQPFNYTDGFHYLLRYVRERMDKEEMMRVCRAMAMFRPSFIALIMNLTPEDLIFMETCFQRTVLEFEKLISFSGTPTVVWRRTGEIALVGKEFSLLTQWSRDQLVNKKTYIYELMDNQSAVEYWEKFSTHAFENTEQTVMTTCILLSPTNRVVPCTFCFTIKRDIFDIPLAIVGNFLPILS
ncbi:Transcriptional regulator of nonfermentable carbon utilization [Mortierella sp. AD094]|nr:Transcriptional regulator of nonfermentable carbon utilization [Mortierella sp. AD094]